MDFAKRRINERFPGTPVRVGSVTEDHFGTLLLSHVLTELTDDQLNELLRIVERATAIVWVEPGTYDTSRRLIGVRERLRTAFNIVAPCTHQAGCGMRASQNSAHWCHHFAPPPPQAFTDGNWARFAALAGIDLRSLPLSFLVLDRRPAPPIVAGAARIIGRPRVYKAHALLMGCTAEGVRESRLTKRALPQEFRQVKKNEMSPLQVLELDGEDIAAVRQAAHL
jgi:ribosomal protein RSM22 (predicted rRNA methylase)